MRTIACLAVVALAIVSAAQAALIVYEPFDYNPADFVAHENPHYTAGLGQDGGLNGTPVSPDGGMHSWGTCGTFYRGYHDSWPDQYPYMDEVIPVSGNLAAPSPLGARGNSVVFGATGYTDRLGLVSTAPGSPLTAPVSSGDLFYSMMVQISDLGTLGVGQIIAAFNNTMGTQANNPTYTPAALWVARGSDENSYKLGVAKREGGSGLVYSGDLPLNQPVFLVVAYHFVAGTVNDTVDLWVNPTLGGDAPAPTVTCNTSAAGDASGLQSFQLRQGTITTQNQLGETGVMADELRIGTTWTDVTTPEPATVALLALGALCLNSRRRA